MSNKPKKFSRDSKSPRVMGGQAGPKKFFGDRTPPRREKREVGEKDQGWDPVAAWYDKLVGDEGSDYHRHVILPATLEMLAPSGKDVVLDLCCGQGVLVRPLCEAGVVKLVGVDASPRLIQAAVKRHGERAGVKFVLADACASKEEAAWANGSYDAATCLMAIHDVPDLRALFGNLSRALRAGGRGVLVFMHPCFRIPRQTHWGWDADQKIQYRRLDRYASDLEIPITTHPGQKTGETTTFYHRSLSEILNALGESGLAVMESRELCTHRRSQVGPRSKAEHRAAEEFPLFLALRVEKIREPRERVKAD